ncbi:EEF1A lysine methyltransferase 1 isoform X3 [Molothrus aeneus]|uniref:EEF1A lysine methyltransferase 1 isoform X3 n=1 Tax=Molothrus aeneus TaxID=84833 RepID=UPI003457E6CB
MQAKWFLGRRISLNFLQLFSRAESIPAPPFHEVAPFPRRGCCAAWGRGLRDAAWQNPLQELSANGSTSPLKMDDDDDIPQLSSHTLAALQEFYLEQQQREGMKTSQGFNQYSIGSIEEDWQLSQFWYSDETASCLAKEAVLAAGKGGSFDVVIADPPYLSEECLQKTAETIKYLTKGKILLCTGAVMEEQAAKHLGVKMCKFIPKHSRNLANEFRCYVNYASGLD